MTDREQTSPNGTSDVPQVTSETTQTQGPVDDKPSLQAPATADPPAEASTNGANEPTQPDVDDDPNRDDSEAETVLSSPVKRREAMKKANGIKTEPEENFASIDAVVHSAPVLAISTELPAEDAVASTAPHVKVTVNAATPTEEDLKTTTAKDKNNDSDGDSDLSEPGSVKSRSQSPSAKRERDTSEGPDPEPLSNPKKRKYRDSSVSNKASGVDATKRQRRSSAIAQVVSGDSSDDGSPHPRQRRHKRTRSAQVDDEHADQPQTGRNRRAASHRLSKEEKTLEPVWDTDSDSNASARPSQHRSTRGGNRSVSTPGRPVGREHKRHVNKYGFTRLAEACEGGDLDAVKEWLEKDRDSIEICEFAGNAPLQIAALNGYPDIVKYLLDNGCNKDCANSDNDTPLIDAVENGHIEVVQVLLAAGVDPLHQNRKGQQALDVITDEVEDGPEIRELLKKAIEDRQQQGVSVATPAPPEEELRTGLGPKQGLHFMARTPENLLKLVANNDRKGVIEFLNARVPVDNNIVAAAAKTGDLYLLNLLLVDMSPRKAKIKAEKPMLAVLGTSHFEVVKTLTELEQFNPLWRSKTNGMTWYETAEDRSGPHWKQERELLHRLYTEAQKHNRLSSSPVAEFKTMATRQRSPAPSKKSDDAEADEGESPDHGRTKRRLIARKNLRGASRHKSPSDEPSRRTASPEPASKSKDVDSEDAPPRKTGRARTKSLSTTQAPEIKTRRIKATRENIALFDSGSNVGKQSRKPSTSSASRPAAESVNAVKKNGTTDEDTAMADAKAEEEAKAERARLEAEAQAQREREEAAAKAQALKEQNLAERTAKLAAMPTALSTALTTDVSGANVVRYLCHKFCPFQAVHGSALGLTGPAADTPWMLSYQAAGVLRGAAADELLSLPTAAGEPAPKTLFATFDTYPLTPEHREDMQTQINTVTLADKMPDPMDKKAFYARIRSETAAWARLEPLFWLKVSDFFAVKALLQNTQAEAYPHLAHMPALPVTAGSRFAKGLTGVGECVVKDLPGLKEGDSKLVHVNRGGRVVYENVVRITQ